jgi:acetylornithine deacetylase
MPGQNAEVLIERARSAAEHSGVEFRRGHSGRPLYVDPRSAFVQEVLRLAGRPAARTVAYGTDGAMLGELKNILVFGPGDIAQAHTHDEWIDLAQLELGTAMYARLIEHFCC